MLAKNINLFKKIKLNSLNSALNKTTNLTKRLFATSNNELSIPSEFYKSLNKLPTYLDNQSTTQIDPRVYEAIIPYYETYYGNAHSRTHKYGWDSSDAVENAREKIAKVIRAQSSEIIFTSGATESNNLAIKGLAYYENARSESTKIKKNHIITLQTEHKCVLESCRYLSYHHGFDITYLPVKQNGLVCLDQLKLAIKKETLIISIMAVHNEIGVIQPLKEIGALTRENGIYFHSDAAQAFGKIDIDVNTMNIDMMSISGHKIYGPKGVGALYVRKKPRVRLQPLIHGGGQERGFRSGTLPTPLIVGLGKAGELAIDDFEKDYNHIKLLRDRFLNNLENELTHFQINGSTLESERYIGNLNISFEGVEGEGLLTACREVALSSGSACTSSSLEPSYVLKALNIRDELSHNSIRIGFGRFNNIEEVDEASMLIVNAVKKLRELSPLWEMIEEGIDLSTIKWSSGH